MTQATSSVDTLTEFLTLGNTHYYIFDLGRLVRQIPNDQFAAMEAGQQPYPAPLQQHAHLGIVFWHKLRPQETYIWFAKFPLDERGLINHAARQHYLQIIMQALGRNITADTKPEQEELLKQNPYTFTPGDDKRAAFHAKVSLLLQQPPSIYFEDVQSFVLTPFASDQSSTKNWHQLGLQGLHDMAVRLHDDHRLCNSLSQNLSGWPAAFKQTLLHALEQHPLPANLLTSLCAQLQQAINHADVTSQLALMRAMAGSVLTNNTPAQLTKFVHSSLKQPLTEAQRSDLLVIVAARLWPLLLDSELRTTYLHIAGKDSALFAHIFADLAGLPALRPYMLQLLREPPGEDASLTTAVNELKTAMLKTTKS